MDLTALTLFGRARYQVLASLFALRKAEAIHLREIARRAGLTPAATQYELRLLTQAGIILQSSSGRSILYRVNAVHPIARELRAIIEKTNAGKQAPVIEDSGPWIRKRAQQKADYVSRAGRQSLVLTDRGSAPPFEVDFRVDSKA